MKRPAGVAIRLLFRFLPWEAPAAYACGGFFRPSGPEENKGPLMEDFSAPAPQQGGQSGQTGGEEQQCGGFRDRRAHFVGVSKES